MRDGRRLGGKLRALQGAIVPAGEEARAPPPWWELSSREDLTDALRDMVRGALARRIDPRTANSISLMIQALQSDEARRGRESELGRRLEDLELEVEDLLGRIPPEIGGVWVVEAATSGLLPTVRRDLERLLDLARQARRLARRC